METVTESQKQFVNRYINGVYLLLGVLQQLIYEMDTSLESAKQGLIHEDKRLLNSIRKDINRLKTNIEILRGVSVFKLDEDTISCFEDTELRFYVLFMTILDVAGVDGLCDLRLYSLFKRVDRLQHRVNYPKLKLQSLIAWKQIVDDIGAGKYNKQQFKTLFDDSGENRTK